MDQAPRREHSVSSLASILSRRDPAPAAARIAIARPTPLIRVLLGAVFVMLLGVGAALLALGTGLTGLVREVDADRTQRLYREREAVPARSVLLDDTLWQRELVARPLAAPVIHRARCEALAADGRHEDVVATIAWIGLNSPGDLLAATRLQGVEALYRLGRIAEAGAELHRLDGAALEPAQRARADELAGRLWLAANLGGRP